MTRLIWWKLFANAGTAEALRPADTNNANSDRSKWENNSTKMILHRERKSGGGTGEWGRGRGGTCRLCGQNIYYSGQKWTLMISGPRIRVCVCVLFYLVLTCIGLLAEGKVFGWSREVRGWGGGWGGMNIIQRMLLYTVWMPLGARVGSEG